MQSFYEVADFVTNVCLNMLRELLKGKQPS